MKETFYPSEPKSYEVFTMSYLDDLIQAVC